MEIQIGKKVNILNVNILKRSILDMPRLDELNQKEVIRLTVGKSPFLLRRRMAQPKK